MYAIATRVYRLQDHDAEDVFQDVFTRTWQHLDDLRDDTAVRPWIGTLTRRLCVDKLRSASREVPVEELIETDADDQRRARGDRRGADGARGDEAASRALRRDPRPVLRPGPELQAIGEALDLPPGTIASRISRCLRKLRLNSREENRGSSRQMSTR